MIKISFVLTDRRFKRAIVAWIIVFTCATCWALIKQREIQRQGRTDRVNSANALASLTQQENQNLKAGEVLVCTKALGTVSAILALATSQSKTPPDATQSAILKEYFALTDPKQCPGIVNSVVPKQKKTVTEGSKK